MGKTFIKTFLAAVAADAAIIGVWAYGKRQYYKGRSSAFKEATDLMENLHKEIEEIFESKNNEES